MVLLVTYDLEEDPDYEAVIDAIDRLGAAVEVQRSVWVVATELDAVSAFDFVAQEITSADRLFVGTLAQGTKWRHALCGSQALKSILGAR